MHILESQKCAPDCIALHFTITSYCENPNTYACVPGKHTET